MKRKPPVKLLFRPFFYERDCQRVCRSWIDRVPAIDIIKNVFAAERSIIFSDAGRSVASINRSDSPSFDEFFRSNRLLFTELLVAIERSRRSPTAKEISFLAAQGTDTIFHKYAVPKIPPGERLHATEVAAGMTEVTGQTSEADALRKASDREGKRRQRTDAYWVGILAKEEKQPLFRAASPGETGAQIALREKIAHRRGDPKRNNSSGRPNRNLANTTKMIERAKELGDKFEKYLNQVIESAPAPK